MLSSEVRTATPAPAGMDAAGLPFGILWLYFGMKTAISLPDALFTSGDALAKRLGLSRSEVYARALAEYVAKYNGNDLTQRINAVYANEDSSIDPALMQAQLRAMRHSPW